MSLSNIPSVKIMYNTPQAISDEILGGAIQFCAETGYKQDMTLLTFFWSSFLLSSKETLNDAGVLDDILLCYTRSLRKVFPEILEDAELREHVSNMRKHYWNQVSANFKTLLTEAEINTLIKMADDLTQREGTSRDQLKKDPSKEYAVYTFNISSNINCILHGIDDDNSIQYKHILDEFRTARVQQQESPPAESQRKTSSTIPSAIPQAKNQPLGMAWYTFLVNFALIAGAIINLFTGVNYICGDVYSIQTNGTISAKQVYAFYGRGLQVVDILFGLYLIFFATFAFVVRDKLVQYKPDALKLIKIFYSFSAGAPLWYAILVAIITEQSLSVESIAATIVGILILICNIKYFKRRAHLFVDKAHSTQPITKPQTRTTSARKTIKAHTLVIPTDSPIAFCQECGTPLLESSSFCHKCGAKSILNAPEKAKLSNPTQTNPIEKLAFLTATLPAFVAKSNKGESNFIKNHYVHCEAIIFTEFFIRTNALEIAPSKEIALKFSDEYITATTNITLAMIPEAKSFLTNMFYKRASLYDSIILNSKEPNTEIVELLSHIIHKEIDENKYIEISDKNFRYFGDLLESLAIRAELVALFECIHSCTKSAMEELRKYLMHI